VERPGLRKVGNVSAYRRFGVSAWGRDASTTSNRLGLAPVYVDERSVEEPALR
jgi:hypothetical protein